MVVAIQKRSKAETISYCKTNAHKRDKIVMIQHLGKLIGTEREKQYCSVVLIRLGLQRIKGKLSLKCCDWQNFIVDILNASYANI